MGQTGHGQGCKRPTFKKVSGFTEHESMTEKHMKTSHTRYILLAFFHIVFEVFMFKKTLKPRFLKSNSTAVVVVHKM